MTSNWLAFMHSCRIWRCLLYEDTIDRLKWLCWFWNYKNCGW